MAAPMDDAFNSMDVTYLRYQDDLLILCRTKRQLQRCKQRMMAVLKERSLRLSRKKTRIGRIELGFHFLGIHYPGTQTPDNTKVEQAVNRAVIQVGIAQYIPLLSVGGADIATNNQTPALDRIVPHPRTLRKAREQVKQMVIDGLSARRIRSYLHRWALWWVRTSQSWQYQELLGWFLEVCWDIGPAAYAAGLLQQAIKRAYYDLVPDLSAVGSPATA